MQLLSQIACLEEIAYRMGYIGRQELEERGKRLGNSRYGQAILALASEIRC